MTWQGIPITGGVVNTRASSHLEPGELVASSGYEMRPGDINQLHPSLTQLEVADDGNTPLLIRLLTFENTANQVLIVVTDGVDTLVKTATAGTGSLTFATIKTITGVATAAWLVQVEDEYQLGTGLADGNIAIKDNVARTLGMTLSSKITSATSWAGALDSTTVAGDVFLYWVTEYDSTIDVESGVSSTTYVKISTNAYGANVAWSATEANSNADKVRLYRGYLGNGNDAERRAQELATISGYPTVQEGLVGGMVTELAVTTNSYADNIVDTFDPKIQYPTWYTEEGGVAVFGKILVKPPKFTLGTTFGASVVVNRPGDDNRLLGFSPPRRPEYQPELNFFYPQSEFDDDVVGLQVINGALVVLTQTGLHRVNYLPYRGNIAGQTGRMQEVITSKEGCVGRRAYTKIQTPQGEFLVWVSPQGLRWTNGKGMTDACIDWSMAGAGYGSANSGVVVENNPAKFRVEVYRGTERWDFYYHTTLVKREGLRCFGPTTIGASVVDVAVGPGSSNDATYLTWLLSSDGKVYLATGSETSASLETGDLRAPTPWGAVELDAVGFDHEAGAGSIALTVTSAEEGEDAVTASASITDLTRRQSSRVELKGVRGNRVSIAATHTTPTSLGPMYIDTEVSQDGNG